MDAGWIARSNLVAVAALTNAGLSSLGCSSYSERCERFVLAGIAVDLGPSVQLRSFFAVVYH